MSEVKRQPVDCICMPPVHNDIAWHHPTCPWRLGRIEYLRNRWGR